MHDDKKKAVEEQKKRELRIISNLPTLAALVLVICIKIIRKIDLPEFTTLFVSLPYLFFVFKCYHEIEKRK